MLRGDVQPKNNGPGVEGVGWEEGRERDEGVPFVPPQMVSRSRCCEYPAQQKSIGRHCLAVGQTMLPSVKMSQSLMTRPVAAPGIHETGIESDFASSMAGLGSMPCLFSLLVMDYGDGRPHTFHAGTGQRGSQGPEDTLPVQGGLLGDRSTEAGGARGAAGDTKAQDA